MDQCSRAIPQKSPCACRLSYGPLLTQLIEWRLGLSQGTALQAATLALRSKPLPLLRQVRGRGVTQGLLSLGRCRGGGPAFPGPLTLERPRRLPLLARGLQQGATPIAHVACQRVVGPRKPRHVIAVEQAGPVAPADRVEVTAKGGAGRWDLRLPRHRVARAAALPRTLCSIPGVRGNGFEEVGDVTAPGGALG